MLVLVLLLLLLLLLQLAGPRSPLHYQERQHFAFRVAHVRCHHGYLLSDMHVHERASPLVKQGETGK